MGKSLQDLGLKDEKLPEVDLAELQEFGNFAPPPPPGAYRFALPKDLSAIWEPIDSQKGQRIRAVFDREHPLVITQSSTGKSVGEPFETRLSNVERKRGKDGPEASDLDYLLKSQGVTQRPSTNRAYIQAIQQLGGKEFGGDIEYSWGCSETRDIRARDSQGQIQVVEGRKGCGAKYYMKDVPKNPDGTTPLEIQCGQCGASLRAFANLQNIRK